MWQDLRHAIRSLSKARGFTVVAVRSLAFGIAANTTVFSVIDASLFRPLPFPHSDRLVAVNMQATRGRCLGCLLGASFAQYETWASEARAAEVLAAAAGRWATLGSADEPGDVSV